MEFHPDEPFDYNLGQRAVWEKLKVALAGLEGHAYYRYPIFQDGGFFRYEIDLLLVLRDHGVIALEVKGCEIRNIASIAGNAWTMDDWYTPTEAPGAQVDLQAFALRDLLTTRTELSCVQVHPRVVLPFVARADWVDCGFDLPAMQIVWTADELRGDAVRAWLGTLPGQGRLDAGVWAVLCGLFQSPAPQASGDGRLRILEYDGHPLDTAQIREAIPEISDNDTSWGYLVATGALEGLRRANFQPPLQLVDRNDAPKAQPVLVFHKVLRHWARERSLRRYEERTLLMRVMRDIAASDETRRRMLEHDVLAWRDVLVRLDEEGIDLQDGVPNAFGGRLVRASLGPFLRELQGRYRARIGHTGAGGSFEYVVRRFLARGFRPPRVVVLEGFTRLTGLQQFFVHCCLERGALVVVIRPFRAAQERGFEAVRAVWRGVCDESDVQSLSTGVPSTTQLRWLQASLFSDAAVPARPPHDGAVLVEAASHPNQEVAAAVRRVVEALEEGVEASEIVVVTRDPGTYVPLILEEAELLGCASYFHIPPRILLLTPVGRFALGLYAAWSDGLHLEASLFESFLASGLLGAAAQETVPEFHRVRVQLFEECTRRDDWTLALATLRRLTRALPDDSRFPAAGVSPDAVDLWEAVVARLDAMCRQLAEGGERSLADHVHVLLDELSRLDTSQVRAAERAILVQIGDALKEVGHDPAIKLSSDEFGAVLVGLAQARDAEETDDDPKRVSVVVSESLDGVRKRRVLALGLDDTRVPRSPPSSWPLEDGPLADHVAQERYQFLAMLRSASERVVLSWSRTDGTERQRPSMYVDDVVALLKLDVVRPPSHMQPAPVSPVLAAPISARRDRYDLEEIAVFRLCPHRYRLELLDKTAGKIGSSFHLAFAVAGRWLELMLSWLADGGGTRPSDKDQLETWLLSAMQATEEGVWREFPALRPFDQQGVEQSLRSTVTMLATDMGASGDYPVSIERRSELLDVTVQVDGRPVSVEATLPFVYRRGRYRYPLLYPHIGQRWLFFGKRPDDDANGPVLEGVQVLAHQYSAVRWWWDGIKHLHYDDVDAPQADLTDLRGVLKQSITDIERGQFPKHAGDHCVWCPAKDTCLGRTS